MKQKYSSANTSINKKRLPRIYNLNLKNISILDYGCGKYTEHIKEKCKENNCIWYGYDKYNQSEKNNKNTIEHCKKFLVDVVLCSNVLNVIQEEEIIIEIIKECLLMTNGYVVVSIYEGNGSGIGKKTKENCYQRNCKKKWYVSFLKNNNFKVKENNEFIYIYK